MTLAADGVNLVMKASLFLFVLSLGLSAKDIRCSLFPGGWNESAYMHACLFVGLMCVSTSSLLVVSKLGPLKILTSCRQSKFNQGVVVVKGRNKFIKVSNKVRPENENIINEAFIIYNKSA